MIPSARTGRSNVRSRSCTVAPNPSSRSRVTTARWRPSVARRAGPGDLAPVIRPEPLRPGRRRWRSRPSRRGAARADRTAGRSAPIAAMTSDDATPPLPRRPDKGVAVPTVRTALRPGLPFRPNGFSLPWLSAPPNAAATSSARSCPGAPASASNIVRAPPDADAPCASGTAEPGGVATARIGSYALLSFGITSRCRRTPPISPAARATAPIAAGGDPERRRAIHRSRSTRRRVSRPGGRYATADRAPNGMGDRQGSLLATMRLYFCDPYHYRRRVPHGLVVSRPMRPAPVDSLGSATKRASRGCRLLGSRRWRSSDPGP